MVVHRWIVVIRPYVMACTVLLRLLLSSMQRMVSAELGEIRGWCLMLDKTEMWRAWQLLNSSRSWMAKVASSLMAVGVSGGVDARELMDGLELPDILYLW